MSRSPSAPAGDAREKLLRAIERAEEGSRKGREGIEDFAKHVKKELADADVPVAAEAFQDKVSSETDSDAPNPRDEMINDKEMINEASPNEYWYAGKNENSGSAASGERWTPRERRWPRRDSFEAVGHSQQKG